MPYQPDQPDQPDDAAGADPNDAETPLSPGGDLLVIDTPGAVLGKHSERLQVRIDRQVVQEAPLFRLRQVVIASRGVQVSSDVIQVCARRGIPLHVLGRWPGDMATVSVPIGNQTVATRRAQFRAADNGLGDTWVRRVIEAKLRTQVALLRYLGKHRREADPPTFDALMAAVSDIQRYADAVPVVGSTPEDVALVARLGGPGTTGFAEAGTVPGGDAEDDDAAEAGSDVQGAGDDVPPTPLMAVLRGLEGAGGRAYWGAVGTVMRSHGVPWTGREYRGTGNAFNAALNYGYGILASQVQTAVHLAGLDPGAGFLHADRAGRSSLVLDAIEEFRQAVVDRPLIGLASRRVAFRMIPGVARLDDPTRRLVADAVLERLDGLEPYGGGRYALRTIVGMQASRLATYLRGDTAAYEAWVGRWW